MKGILLVEDEAAFTVVAGLPVFTRAVCAGHKGGIEEWFVLGTDKTIDRSRQIVMNETRLSSLPCTVALRQNLSLEQLRQWLGDELALLVPCQGVFDYRFIRQFCACSRQEACWFSTGDGQETGIAYGSATFLWRVLQNSQEAGPTHSLSSSLTLDFHSLVPVKTGLWVLLTAGQKEVEQRLLASLGRDTDGFLARALDRKISRALTCRLAFTTVTPNQITLVSFLIGVLSVWLLAAPDYGKRVIGAILLLASVIIDGCDGELARLKYLESEFGAKFDLIADNVVHLLLFPGIALGLYRETALSLYATLAGVALVGVLCSMAVAYLAIFRSPSGLAATTGKRTSIAEFYERLAGRDFAYVLLVLAIANRLHWFLWATVIGTYIFAGGLLVVYLAQRYKAAVGRLFDMGRVS